MTFAQRLTLALKARGMSQNGLDKAAPLSKGQTNSYCTGRRRMPRGDALERMASTLRVSSAWLANGKGPSGLEDGGGLPLPHLSPDPFAKHPNLRTVLDAASGFYAPEVEEMMKDHGILIDHDPSVKQWNELLRALQTRFESRAPAPGRSAEKKPR